MPHKREGKATGFRGIFGKKRYTSQTKDTVCSNATGPEGQQNQASPARRIYTPRYAERDMILAMPIEQRPDLVAKANEARLQRACSEIGFNSASSARSSFVYTRSLSHLPHEIGVHPALRDRRELAKHTPMATSTHNFNPSTHSAQGSSTPRSASMPAVPLKLAHYDQDSQWLGKNSDSLDSIPQSSTLQSEFSQIDCVDHALRRVGGPSRGGISEPDTSMSSARGAVHHFMTATSPPRQSRAYFSHNGTVPNLRATKDKGKAAVVGPQNSAGYNIPQSHSQDPYHSRDSYVVGSPIRAVSELSPPSQHPPAPPCDAPPKLPSVTDSESSQHTHDIWSATSNSRSVSVYTICTSVDDLTGLGFSRFENGELENQLSFQLPGKAQLPREPQKIPSPAVEHKG